ncbi:MAG: ATP-binding cassette domain-containing protein [Elusimicrobiales bacterium]
MIKAEKLHRRYGAAVAVSEASFEIGQGEVVGFLGPNGAGKTTTLRMLAGILSPTSGRAAIAGIDVEENPSATRAKTGYLPENNPLYEEMEVSAFLEWSGQMRGMSGGALENAVSSAVARCALKSVIGKDIGELSKGYRQRVGLAGAILHNPPVLLLDEPTSGLDPNQALEVRGLINELRRETTIMLSTHILSEAQSMCDRVIIIDKGRIAADGKAAELAAASGADTLILTLEKTDPQPVCAAITALGASSCGHEEKAGEAVFSIRAGEDLRARVFAEAVKNGWKLLGLERKTASLEDVFRSLTK